MNLPSSKVKRFFVSLLLVNWRREKGDIVITYSKQIFLHNIWQERCDLFRVVVVHLR